MAGYIKTRKDPRTGNQRNIVSKTLRNLSNLGMNFDNKIFKNSHAIGLYEVDSLQKNTNKFVYEDSVYDIFNGFSFTDSSMHKNISLYDRVYDEGKRMALRRLAVQDEIEEILDIVCDDSICYNQNGLFCELLYNQMLMDDKKKDEMMNVFNDIYAYFGFYDQNMAWGYFRKFLVDGFLAFEILYNTDGNEDVGKQKHIIGFQELDTLSLIPAIDEKTGEKIWIQYKDDPVRQRVLYDSQIIYISYSQFDSATRISYVERLTRAFNLLRIMESTRIIWAVSNASFKTMFTIPVENNSNRGRQTLAETMHSYREIVDFNWESGEIMSNGKPMMPFNKEYWFPSVNGESPQVSTLGGDGPDLADTEALKYFKMKLWQASKVPFSRFDVDQGRGQYAMTTESMQREEIKFANFVNRLRSIFKEILIKPIYIQLCLLHQEYINDTNFRNTLALKYVNDNVFTEKREIELIQQKADFIGSIMQTFVTQDAEGNEQPYWDLDYLIRRFGGFTNEDLENNAKIQEVKKLVKEGYKEKDAEKIADGEDPSKFKKEKKEEKGEEEEGGDNLTL
ncbi:MAG: portal protein [Alphaproteobacteria bacterium]|nr:portal protein [Alphaproteobacteria bacterium]